MKGSLSLHYMAIPVRKNRHAGPIKAKNIDMEICLYHAQERVECEISTVRVTAMHVQFHIC